MNVTNDFGVLTNLAQITDPRRTQCRKHELVDILFVAICGAIAGCDTWTEIVAFAKERLDWLRQFVPLANGVPSHDTFGRVFAIFDTGEFLAFLQGWMGHLVQATGGRVIAIDGKTLRNSVDAAGGRKALHLVSAWATQNRVVLGQVATDEKSNEITAIPQLLAMLDLNGAVVTIDAMGCQKEIARQIQQRGGDYLLALKGNHEKLFAAVQQAFRDALAGDGKSSKLRQMTQKERRRGRNEERDYLIMPVPKDLPGRDEWPGLRSLGMVIRRRLPTDAPEDWDVRYYLCSTDATVRRFAQAVRAHWGIENHLHWSLDVIFTEDKSRIHQGNARETTALLRRVALSKLQQDTSLSCSLRIKRKVAGWSTDALARILAGSSEN